MNISKVLKYVAFLCVTATVGCNFSESQQLIVSRTAGVIAVATWRSVDNPSADEIDTMKTIVTYIEDECGDGCGEDGSYYTRVYPLVEQYIETKVRIKDQLICKLGAAFVLVSIDTAFAANPDWKAGADQAVNIIKAFCEGARIGLSLLPGDAIISSTGRQTQTRMMILNAK